MLDYEAMRQLVEMMKSSQDSQVGLEGVNGLYIWLWAFLRKLR